MSAEISKTVKRLLQTQDRPSTLKSFVRSSINLSGVIFVLLRQDDPQVLNSELPHVLRLAREDNARFIGMISGLLQFLVADDAPDQIEERTRMLSEHIIKSTQQRATAVWTVQPCALGSWGDDTNIAYGALVPNFQRIMSALGAANPGENVKVL